jgi:hypothetical protein
MKRPILKRTVRTVEIVTWTLAYEDVPEEELPAPAPAETADRDNTQTPPAEPTEKTENREPALPFLSPEEVQRLDKR